MRGGGGMFIHTVTVRRVRLLAAAGALVLCGAAVFLYPSAAAAGASRGMALCSSVIIPSLLPFLVLCGTFLHSALCKAAGRVLRRPTALLFRLPGCCGAPVLMAFVGGYPAGAAAIATLLERREITEKDAERMLHFCVCAGPAFTVGAVGSGMLGSALSVGDGYEHFDGNSAPHAHLHCKRCGKIYDAPLKQDILSGTANENDFSSETTVYIVYGVCSKCRAD